VTTADLVSSGFEIVTRDAAEFDWSAWNHLVDGNGIYARSEWVRPHLPPGARVLEVRDASGALAGALAYWLAEHPPTAWVDPYEQFLQVDPRWRPAMVGELTPELNPATAWMPFDQPTGAVDPHAFFPALLCGQAGTEENHLVIRADMRRGEVIRALLAQLEDDARRCGARCVLFPYYPVADAAGISEAAPDYLPLFMYPRHHITVPPTFDEYLQSLQSRARSDARRRQRAYLGSGCRTVELDCHARGPEIRALFQRHAEKHGEIDADVAMGDLSIPGLTALVLGTLFEDRLIGVAHFFALDRAWQSHHIGFADELAKQARAYFNLTYYDPIRLAAERQIRTIDYRYWFSHTKISIGATASPRFFVVRCFDRALHDHLRPTARRAMRALEMLETLLASHRRDSPEVAEAIQLTSRWV